MPESRGLFLVSPLFFTLELEHFHRGDRHRDTGVAVRADTDTLIEPVVDQFHRPLADWTGRAGVGGGRFVP